MQKKALIQVTLEGDTEEEIIDGVNQLVARSNKMTPINITTGSKTVEYTDVTDQYQNTSKEEMSFALAFGVVALMVISGIVGAVFS